MFPPSVVASGARPPMLSRDAVAAGAWRRREQSLNGAGARGWCLADTGGGRVERPPIFRCAGLLYKP